MVEPLNSDLNTTDTVIAINDYVVNKHADMAELRVVSEDVPADLTEQQLYTLGVLLDTVYTQADGSPFSSNIRLQLDEPNRTRWDTLVSKAGPFHVVLELCKLTGATCGPLFLSSLIHSKRSGPGAQRWFLDPGDPSQHLNESREYLFSAYVSATIEYIVYTEGQTKEQVAESRCITSITTCWSVHESTLLFSSSSSGCGSRTLSSRSLTARRLGPRGLRTTSLFLS